MVITMATTAAATAVFLFNFMPAVSAALIVLQHLGLRRSLARLMVDSLVACRLLLLLLLLMMMMIFMMMVSLVDKPPFTFASTVAHDPLDGCRNYGFACAAAAAQSC